MNCLTNLAIRIELNLLQNLGNRSGYLEGELHHTTNRQLIFWRLCMKPFKSIFKLSVVLTTGLLLAGCLVKIPKNFPQTDIVFQRVASNSSDERERRNSLGFVNADGSGLTIVKLTPQPGSETLIVFPIWSSDGSTLIFRGGSYPDPSTGELLTARAGKGVLHCPKESSFGLGRASLLEGAKQVVAEIISDLPDQVVLINLNDCTVDRTYLSNSDKEFFVGVSAIRSGQLLAFGHSKNISYYSAENDIVILDTASGTQTIVANGAYPAGSPDDQWIAYTAEDGIYVVRQDGSQRKQVSTYSPLRTVVPGESPTRYSWEKWPPTPSWSPDGKWLVYHKCMLPLGEECREGPDFSIFKVNVETGEEVKIVDGGLNPYWRQK